MRGLWGEGEEDLETGRLGNLGMTQRGWRWAVHGREAGWRGHVSFTFVAGDCDTFRGRSSYGAAMKTAPNHIPHAAGSVAPRRQNIPVRVTVQRPQRHVFRSVALRGAYTLLAAVSIFTVILDHCKRRDAATAASSEVKSIPGHYVPTPITPLADSPFLRKSSPSRIAAASPLDEVQKEVKQRSLIGSRNRG